ncbi:hypothetical protein [Aeoliella sp. SH292]|uniref:hypothetical protein n=1 Tax=Aeoliella sp. SH292 TaxID=3454464 RepID=UPI003F9D0C40
MALRFDQHRDARPRRSLLGGLPLRLVSLVVSLGVIFVLMDVLKSPATREKLALMFGDAAPVAEPPPAEDQPGRPAYLASVDRDKLDAIEDNTTFRDEESDAWFNLVAAVRDASDEDLKAASVGEIVFAQYLGQPKVYRGRVVELDGNVRRVESITPAANDLGITQLYRVILQPSRDIRRPFTLYCLELPKGWSVGGAIPDGGAIATRAVFFKNWVYNYEGGVDLSPVFVARSFTPIAEPTPLVERGPMIPLWQVFALAGLASALVVAWIVWKSKEDPRPDIAPDPEELAHDFESLTYSESGPSK